jgi:hypothetical protein
MTLPDSITSGFNLAEAIALAKFTDRALQVFDHPAAGDGKELYNLLFKGDAWVCVHALRAPTVNAQALILKRADALQFALVLSTPLPNTKRVPSDTLLQPTGVDDQVIPVVNLTAAKQPRSATSGLDGGDSAEYPPIEGEIYPPLRGARVYRPWLRAWEACQAEVDLFFQTLSGMKFVQPKLVDLIHREADERATRLAAVRAALVVKLGEKAGEKLGKTLGQFLQQVDSGQIEQPTTALEQLIAKERTTQTLLIEPTDHFEVYVTGHSAGGCIAALAALGLKRTWEARIDFPRFRLKLYTFGSPMLGNRAFAEYFNVQMKGYSHRVQNLLDGATYEPSLQRPLLYNLQSRLPGVDYVRHGTHYYTAYTHVGEAFVLPGLGDPTLKFNFRKGFKPLLPLPFAHDPEGYTAMLHEARTRQAALRTSVQQVAGWLEQQKDQFLTNLQKQSAELQKAATRFQAKVDDV